MWKNSTSLTEEQLKEYRSLVETYGEMFRKFNSQVSQLKEQRHADIRRCAEIAETPIAEYSPSADIAQAMAASAIRREFPEAFEEKP